MRILRFTTASRSCHLAVAFATVASLQVMNLVKRESPRATQPTATELSAAPSVSAVLDWIATMKESRPAGWQTQGEPASSGVAMAAAGDGTGGR